ncbi:Ferredoxin-dependent glutamate synthase [Spatholobus suberectus]|nr:Ferredoxin-dependent glutamate synthase [Spatholobus suberectus]
MDSEYFVSRNEILTWINNRIQLNLSLIEKVARETLSFWVKAFSEDTAKRLENFGYIQFILGGLGKNGVPESTDSAVGL